jgi:hypothetical protein
MAGPRSASSVIPALPSKHSSSVPDTFGSTTKEEQSINSPLEIADGVVVHPVSKRIQTAITDIRFI